MAVENQSDTRSVSLHRGVESTSLRSAPHRTSSGSRARCASRLAAVTDRRLSMGARTTYVLLDDYAGLKGVCWPKQQTLSHRLGASRQAVQRWVAELAAAGWLRIERTGRAHRYTLKWASAAVSVGHRISICQPVVMEPSAAAAAVEPTAADAPPPRPCPRCQDTGEREYHVPPSINSLGRAIPGRRWRGICGCGGGQNPAPDGKIVGPEPLGSEKHGLSGARKSGVLSRLVTDVHTKKS